MHIYDVVFFGNVRMFRSLFGKRHRWGCEGKFGWELFSLYVAFRNLCCNRKPSAETAEMASAAALYWERERERRSFSTTPFSASWDKSQQPLVSDAEHPGVRGSASLNVHHPRNLQTTHRLLSPFLHSAASVTLLKDSSPKAWSSYYLPGRITTRRKWFLLLCLEEIKMLHERVELSLLRNTSK